MPDTREVLARIADRTTRWVFYSWYWGDAIAVDGLLAADAVGAGGHRARVVGWLDRWARTAPDLLDDALAPGRAVIELVQAGELDPRAAQRVLDAIERLPLLDDTIPALEPHRVAYRFGVCIDALYHLPATLAAAGRWRDDPGLGEWAARIALRTLAALACPAGWAQWYDAARGRNNAVAWSRGLGWALLGVLDLLELLGDAAPARLHDAAGEILRRLAATQEEDGSWRAVLDRPTAACETSTAAFFVAGALHPMARELGPLPGEALARARRACASAVTPEGVYGGVSADVLPSWDATTYDSFATEPSPWGQGAALRAYAALVAHEATADIGGRETGVRYTRQGV